MMNDSCAIISSDQGRFVSLTLPNCFINHAENGKFIHILEKVFKFFFKDAQRIVKFN